MPQTLFMLSFKLKSFFNNFFNQHNYVCLNEKPHPYVFCEITMELFIWNCTHIEYMTKYFMKCYNCLNHFKSLFALCNILAHVLIFHKCII
jgi:hypothetical protein